MQGLNYWVVAAMPKEEWRQKVEKRVILEVCNYFEVTIEELRSPNRLRKLVDARSIISYILSMNI